MVGVYFAKFLILKRAPFSIKSFIILKLSERYTNIDLVFILHTKQGEKTNLCTIDGSQNFIQSKNRKKACEITVTTCNMKRSIQKEILCIDVGTTVEKKLCNFILSCIKQFRIFIMKTYKFYCILWLFHLPFSAAK